MRDYILRKVAESHNGWARAKMCSEAQKGLTRATAWSESDWSNSNEGVGKETVLMTSSVVALCWCVWLVWALQGLGLSDAKGTHLLSYNCIFRDFMWQLVPGWDQQSIVSFDRWDQVILPINPAYLADTESTDWHKKASVLSMSGAASSFQQLNYMI